MLNKISFKFAVTLLITLLISIILFHILVLVQIIPYTIVWGGKIHSVSEMIRFELISILVNLFLILIVTVKGNLIHLNVSKTILNSLLWLFIVLFTLNTIGNLLSETSIETIVFTPLTIVMALLCYRLIQEKKVKTN